MARTECGEGWEKHRLWGSETNPRLPDLGPGMFGRAAEVLSALVVVMLLPLPLPMPVPDLSLMMLPLLARWCCPVGSTMDTLFGPAEGVTTDIILVLSSCAGVAINDAGTGRTNECLSFVVG